MVPDSYILHEEGKLMDRTTTVDRLRKLKIEEQQLIARSRALKAQMAEAQRKSDLRRHIVLGRAVERWLAATPDLLPVLRTKLRPHVFSREWTALAELLEPPSQGES
jgi:hypothetical protein